jgi:hypothetical protein
MRFVKLALRVLYVPPLPVDEIYES